MNKHMLTGVLLGTIIATAGGAYAIRSATPQSAAIVSVTPITVGMEQQFATVTQVEPLVTPGAPTLATIISSKPIIVAGQVREVCEERTVTHQAPSKDENQIAGTAAGAVIGGLLGNQVGGGNGKKAATALGAIAGGLIGKNAQAQHQQQQTYQTVEQVCNNIREPNQTTGYEVTVNAEGQPKTITTSYLPKQALPVVNGEVITDINKVKAIKANMPPPMYEVTYSLGDKTGMSTLAKAPNVGAEVPFEFGQLLTTPEQLANLKARENTVIAYNVMYQSDAGIGNVRMTQHPTGDTLQLKRGKPVVPQSDQ